MEGVFEKHESLNKHSMRDIKSLVNHLFKLAEINKIPEDRDKWVTIDLYDEHENKHNSSIFLEPHEEYLTDDQKAIFATCSSTVMIITDDNMLHLFERVYDHKNQRMGLEDDEEIIKSLMKCDEHEFVDHESFTNAAYIESYISKHF